MPDSGGGGAAEQPPSVHIQLRRPHTCGLAPLSGGEPDIDVAGF